MRLNLTETIGAEGTADFITLLPLEFLGNEYFRFLRFYAHLFPGF